MLQTIKQSHSGRKRRIYYAFDEMGRYNATWGLETWDVYRLWSQSRSCGYRIVRTHPGSGEQVERRHPEGLRVQQTINHEEKAEEKYNMATLSRRHQAGAAIVQRPVSVSGVTWDATHRPHDEWIAQDGVPSMMALFGSELPSRRSPLSTAASQ